MTTVFQINIVYMLLLFITANTSQPVGQWLLITKRIWVECEEIEILSLKYSHWKQKPCSLHLASFSGLHTVHFLIACSVQKWREQLWSILSREWLSVYQGTFCPKHWSYEHSQSEKHYVFLVQNEEQCILSMGDQSRHWHHSHDKMD